MATTAASAAAAATSPNGFNHTNNNNTNDGSSSHCNGNNASTNCRISSSSQSPLATPTMSSPNTNNLQQSQSQSEHLLSQGLQRQLLQLKLKLKLKLRPPNLLETTTPRSSHSNNHSPFFPSMPKTLPQMDDSGNKSEANTPRTLHMQPHQSQSLPLHYNQYTPSVSHKNENAHNNTYLLPGTSFQNSTSRNGFNPPMNNNTISPPRSGSLLGPSTPSFKLNSPSPTTPTFATSFPSTISQQSADNLNPQDYDFIFDVRPFNLFSKSRINKATNLCLPTTLLKRNSKSLIDLINMVDLSSKMKDTFISHLQKEEEEGDATKLSILVYDQCSSNEAITFPLYQTVSKFEKYHNKFNIYYLNGGFSGVLTQNNGVVETTPLGSDGGNSADSNGHRKTKSLSGFTLPSATNFKTKFVQSIKKNNDYDVKKESDSNKEFFSDLPNKGSIDTVANDTSGGDPSYKYKLRNIPSDLTLPKWLQFMKQGSNDESLQYMISKFNKIEEIEKSRLNKMASNFKSPHTSNIQGQDKIFSPCCPECSTIDFQLPQGIEFGYKNRFNNVWPYEHSRVKLGQKLVESKKEEQKIDTQENHQHQQQQQQQQHHHHDHQHHHHNYQHNPSPHYHDDYFNGNYINTSALICNDITYIATQNPLSSTIDDFWSTVELEDVQIIIDLETKPVQYLNHPKIKSIEVIDTPYPDFKLRLINNRVYHFHYLSWPDFGIPQSFQSILDMVKYKNQLTLDKQLNNKLLVHCTAGCGRTGVFITIDSLIQAWKNLKSSVMELDIDLVYKLVQHQRRQRVGMVQNLDQFIIIYEIFIEYLINNQ